jgi:hypothetical protein
MLSTGKVNAIIKCAHQMLGNLIMSFQLQDKHLYDLDDPWVGILAAVAFALCLTYHTTLRPMPVQLVFGRDMILNVQHFTKWTTIKKCEQQHICKNNQIKNSKQVS